MVDPLPEEELLFIDPDCPELPRCICVPFIEPELVVPEPIVDLDRLLLVDEPFCEPEEFIVLPELLPLFVEPVVVCACALKVAMPISMAPSMITFFITLRYYYWVRLV
ncbi:hypothetical protein GCM10028817_36600 [Spirosoma pomorum]